MKSQKTWALVGLAVLAAATAAGAWIGLQTPAPNRLQSTSFQAPPQRRDFSLLDQDGQRVSLATYEGKWLLMFFGFTSCPEACPMAMQLAVATLGDMGEAANTIQPIFISIDPERDTPALLKDYLSHFSHTIAGLSGTAEKTAAIAKAYGVYYRKRAIEGDYTMDHSTAFYLVAPDGSYVQPFRADVDPSVLAADLTRVMNTTK